MDGDPSCPHCDSSVLTAEAVCPRCGFALMDERVTGGTAGLVCRLRHRRSAPALGALAAAALIVTGCAALVFFGVPAALAPSSEPLSATEVERRLVERYPHLRHAKDAVIACPDRAIQPGGEARCWVLARVGLQRAVIVRVTRHGNGIQIDD